MVAKEVPDEKATEVILCTICDVFAAVFIKIQFF
jgi:hypothetical protein